MWFSARFQVSDPGGVSKNGPGSQRPVLFVFVNKIGDSESPILRLSLFMYCFHLSYFARICELVTLGYGDASKFISVGVS